jgi:predicted O-methyltransferase YrrM
MPLDRSFQERVAPLYVPVMGTELVAPLLYDLVRMLRPRRVLEVGAGYTTPFIARALVDTREEAATEAVALAEKTAVAARAGSNGSREWLERSPAFASPAFHELEYDPQLVVLDDFSVERSSASEVERVLESFGLDEIVTHVHSSIRNAPAALPSASLPIDFAWVDAWACFDFFEHSWDLVRRDGGLAAFHYLLGYEEGEAIVEYIKAAQHVRPNELEVLSLVEPHKLKQNSLTLVRRTAPAGE